MVEITPEIQEQLNEQKKHCIFCKIIKGEQESKIVYKDKLMIGTLDINPVVEGHMLLMPKEHYPIMPYLPADTFKHFFGMMPQLLSALKSAMITPGAAVFIANGGAAGQQSPHFLVHLFAREKNDKLSDHFNFSKKQPIDEKKAKEVNEMLAHNMPLMMKNHFSRNPAKWLNDRTQTADHLVEIKKKQKLIYEDAKALCVVAENPQAIGHLEIYSQDTEKEFDKLDKETSAHLFYVASFCATAVFEGLGAHGSNIILKTGQTYDNQEGKSCIHVLPRFEGDGLKVMWEVKQPTKKPNLDGPASKIKDKMFMVEYSQKEKRKPEVIDMDSRVEVISAKKKKEKKEEVKEDEVSEAIKQLRKG